MSVYQEKRGHCVPVEYDGPPAGRRAGSDGMASSVHKVYTDEEREFLVAIDRYKRTRRRPHPTCREVLAVVKSLGYVKG